MINTIKSKFSGDGLKAKALRGSVWLAVGNLAEKILAFTSKIILARLLLPTELDVIVLIVSITALFECITEIGVKHCVIQNPNGNSYEFLNTAFWFQAVRSCILYMIAYFLSPLFCRFYFSGKEEILTSYDWSTLYNIARLAFLSILLNGFISPATFALEKNLKFNKVILYKQSSAIAGTLLTIVLTFVMKNVWALVYGLCLQCFLRALLSYVVSPFKPEFSYHKASMADIIIYAKGMFGAPMLTYLAYNMDILIGGKFLPAGIIGMYGFAKHLAEIPRDLFSRIVSPTLIPAISAKQNDLSSISRNINKLLKNIAIIYTPFVVLIFLFRNEIITGLYGSDFSLVAFAFAIYNINTMFSIGGLIIVSVLLAIGKPELVRKYTFLRVVLICFLIYPCTITFQVNGLATLFVIANAMTMIWGYTITVKLLSPIHPHKLQDH